MQQHIAIAMGDEPLLVRDLDPANNQAAACFEAVSVMAKTNAGLDLRNSSAMDES